MTLRWVADGKGGRRPTFPLRRKTVGRPLQAEWGAMSARPAPGGLDGRVRLRWWRFARTLRPSRVGQGAIGMSTLGAIGNVAQAAATDATEAVATSDGKEEAAAFLKQLALTALTMASNSLMEAQDTMNDLEDDDDE